MNYNKSFNYFKYLMREQFDIIKNKRCNYLLYTTGAGGEFLCEIIKEYSDVIMFFQPCLLYLANEIKTRLKR